jgi:hypothetical protein
MTSFGLGGIFVSLLGDLPDGAAVPRMVADAALRRRLQGLCFKGPAPVRSQQACSKNVPDR